MDAMRAEIKPQILAFRVSNRQGMFMEVDHKYPTFEQLACDFTRHHFGGKDPEVDWTS